MRNTLNKLWTPSDLHHKNEKAESGRPFVVGAIVGMTAVTIAVLLNALQAAGNLEEFARLTREMSLLYGVAMPTLQAPVMATIFEQRTRISNTLKAGAGIAAPFAATYGVAQFF